MRVTSCQPIHIFPRFLLTNISLSIAWVQDALIPVILREPTMPPERKIHTIRSLAKVMWIQNDLFSRHYTVRSHDAKAVSTALKERDEDLKASRISSPIPKRSDSHDSTTAGSRSGAGSESATGTTMGSGYSFRPPGGMGTRPSAADPDKTFGPFPPREKLSLLRFIGL